MNTLANLQPAKLLSKSVARELTIREVAEVGGGATAERMMSTTKFTNCTSSVTQDCEGVDGPD